MSSPYDVIVIGSGAGGAACAWALASGGASVLVLEAGPWYRPEEDYPLTQDDWERLFPHKVPIAGRQVFAPMQRLEAAYDHLRSSNHLKGLYNPSDRRVSWGYHHVVGVGGSTLQYTGESHRMHPRSMRMRSDFGVALDWPLSYADLEPFYLEAENLIGIAGAAQDAHRPRSGPYPLPPHRQSYASQILGQAFESLGLSWTPNPLAALTQAYDGRPPCNFCGGCLRGCNRRDKGSADLTFVAKALATGNCKVESGVQVTALEAGTNDRVRAIHATSADGKTLTYSAPRVVVACGAIETPRLLLNSVGGRDGQGLANESGAVGRHLTETIVWTSTGLHPDPIGSHRGHPVDSLCWDFNAPDAIDGAPGGCRFGLSNAESDLVGPINHAKRIVGGWGREHKRRMRETFGRVLSVAGIGESLPNAGSYVDLDPQAVDEAGMPRARIHSRIDEPEIKRLEFMRGICDRVLKTAGVPEVLEQFSSYDIYSATHVGGTCAMGTDADTTVVNAALRSHAWKNLYIADASVFPSSGGGESPSLTINALAIRAAREMLLA